MALIVQKFGGTSVGTPQRIKNVAIRVAKWQKGGHQVVVIVSAMAGETNRLLSLISDITEKHVDSEIDVIAATGEQVTIGLLSLALKQLGVQARSFTGWQIPVKTDGKYTKARIVNIAVDKIFQETSRNIVPVIAGFQGIDDLNKINTLGRGGSDTSAVAIAAAIGADECQIFTDVDGVYTTDPRVVKSARLLKKITFEEMLEMASLGSKVLQLRAVEFAGKYRVKLRVLSSLTEPNCTLENEAKSGTLITYEEDINMEKAEVSGIAFNKDEAKVTIVGVPDEPGVAFKILEPVASANIEVDVIVQNVGRDGTTDFSFTVPQKDLAKTIDTLQDVSKEIRAREIIGDDKICKVGLVGVGMRSHVGIACKMFKALSNQNINIKMISTSEIKITIVIDENLMESATQILHETFGLDKQ